MLTKTEILSGRVPEEVYIAALDGTVNLHPLTEAEYAAIRVAESDGMTVKWEYDNVDGKVDKDSGRPVVSIDPTEREKAASIVNAMAVAFSLSTEEEPWTPEEVHSITPPHAVAEMAQHVWRISNLAATADERDEVENGDEVEEVAVQAEQFREDEAGQAPGGDTEERDEACGEAG